MGLPWRRPELERGERRPKIQIQFSFSSVPQVGMTLSLLLEYRWGTDMLRMNMLVVSQVVSFIRPDSDGNKTIKTKCSDLRTRYLVIRITRRPSAHVFLFFGHRWVCFFMLECPTTKNAPTRPWLSLPSLSTMVCTGLDSPAKCVKKIILIHSSSKSKNSLSTQLIKYNFARSPPQQWSGHTWQSRHATSVAIGNYLSCIVPVAAGNGIHGHLKAEEHLLMLRCGGL